MSKEFTCDSCGNKAEAAINISQPKGWMQVRVSGYVPRSDSRMGNTQTVNYDLCDVCLIQVFPDELSTTDAKTEFAELAMELIREMVEGALDDAQR